MMNLFVLNGRKTYLTWTIIIKSLFRRKYFLHQFSLAVYSNNKPLNDSITPMKMFNLGLLATITSQAHEAQLNFNF